MEVYVIKQNDFDIFQVNILLTNANAKIVSAQI